MSEEQKLFWKIYEEFCSTKYILENTENIIDEYLTKTNRNIIDIGCGQSSYILDFHNKKKHNLFACDNDEYQINALKRRIKEINSDNKIEYSTNSFPNDDFKGIIFDTVILNNILHFFDIGQIHFFIKSVEKQIQKNSLILINVHSKTHKNFGDYSYFKYYFDKKKLETLFGYNNYDWVILKTIDRKLTNFETEIQKEWIKRYCENNGVLDKKTIENKQKIHLKNNEIHQIELLVRKK